MPKRKLDEWEITGLDINNAPLLGFEVDVAGRQLRVKVAAGRLLYSNGLVELGMGTLTFSGWSCLEVCAYSEEEHQWLGPTQADGSVKLKTLGEVSLNPKQILLHGDDLKTGKFVCYRIENASIEAAFES